MVLLDLQKAFDTVDHCILINKLQALGFDTCSREWFRSYLTNRKQLVDIAGTLSPFQNVTCGVPQGSILGPLLFLVYVNDMCSAVNCKLLLYADDSALIVPGKDVKEIEIQLTKELKSISNWLTDNKLSLHLGKTESIVWHQEKTPVYVNPTECYLWGRNVVCHIYCQVSGSRVRSTPVG